MVGSINRRVLSMVSAGIGLFMALATHAADAPQVIRTFTHHQVTALPQGISGFRPVVSDSGNRILFGVAPAGEGRAPGIAVCDFDGGNLAVIDDTPGILTADLSADGSRVAWILNGNEIRVAGPDGRERKTIFKSDGSIIALRVSGDGRTVVFLNGRGMNVQAGDKSISYIRGIYAIGTDGTGFRRLAGPDEIAKLRGINPDEVGSPNFGTFESSSPLDVSTNGGHVVFGCYAKTESILLGCDGDGGNLHVIAEGHPDKPREWYDHNFAGVSLSGDGKTVAYVLFHPDELGVVGFDGQNRRVLIKTGDDPDFAVSASETVYITVDGRRLTYYGRHFNTDGSGFFQLMATHQDGVLRYSEYPRISMDAVGRRFAHFAYTPQPMQLATMELNVPLDQLRGAPRISQVMIDPPAIPRQKQDVPNSRTSARVESTLTAKVSATGFRGGTYDFSLAQGGSVGITDHFDDGKTDASGDDKAGDAIFTRRWLAAYPDAPADPPRTIRIEAQVQDAGKLFHAEVVEVGLLPVVEGKPAGPPVTIDVKPPPPPTVSTTTDGNTTTPDPKNPTDPKNPAVPKTGAIDLTGYWKSDQGAIYFIRQIGDKVFWYMDNMPSVRNSFAGSIGGDVVTGEWADLPGGTAIETGAGTLKMKIESNDKLSKISATSNYGDSVLIRIAKPPGASVGISSFAGGGGGGGGSGGGGGGGGEAKAPWDTAAGQAAIERWIAEASAKLNAYDGGKTFNDLKPWGIHPKYGTLTNKKATSAFAPDDFPRFNNNKYWYIWANYTTNADKKWPLPEWNGAGVPDLHDYVMKQLK